MRPGEQNDRSSSGAAASRLLADATNRRIVELLAVTGRLTFSELARRVHLSTPALIARVRRLEQGGVIHGYRADVDAAALGLPVGVYILLACTRAMEQRLARDLADFPEVTVCELVTGDVSFVLRASVESVEHMAELLERLARYGEPRTLVVLERLDTPALPRPSSAGAIPSEETRGGFHD